MFTALSGVSRSGLAAYGTSALLLGLFWLPVYLPPQSLWLAGPLSLAKPERYFSGYVTANAAGLPVLWGVLQPVLWAVLAGAGLVIPGRRLQRVRRGYEARALFRNLTEMEEAARAKAASQE